MKTQDMLVLALGVAGLYVAYVGQKKAQQAVAQATQGVSDFMTNVHDALVPQGPESGYYAQKADGSGDVVVVAPGGMIPAGYIPQGTLAQQALAKGVITAADSGLPNTAFSGYDHDPYETGSGW